MALTTKPILFTDPFTSHKLEAISTNIKLSHSQMELAELEDKLQNFDCELAYTNLCADLAEKYNLNKVYYELIEEIRDDLIESGIDVNCKERLITKLDKVVTSLQKDFSLFIEEKYQLLDEIFLIKTNSHWKFNMKELTSRVMEVVDKPNVIYKNEIKKIAMVHGILEEEENRLTQFKSQTKRAQFYL